MRFYRALQRGLALLGLIVLVVTFTPLDAAWLRWNAGPWNDPKGDVLIVLGGDLIGDALGVASYWRCIHAARAWREGGFRKVLVPGGFKYANGPTLANRMRDFLICQGIPADAIQAEEKSLSTRENALYTADLIQQLPGRKVLLTSDLHMFRAYRVFRKLGLDIAPRPFPDGLKRGVDPAFRWGVFIELCVEEAKTVYYFARGWI